MAHGHAAHDPMFVMGGIAALAFCSMTVLSFGLMSDTAVFGLILAVIIITLATEKVDKTIVAMSGGLFCLFLGHWRHIIHAGAAGEGSHALADYIPMIDFSTIGVIVGTTIYVELASRSGLFTWSAILLLKKSKGDPFKLLIYFSILTVLFSAFLNNVTAMIIVGSLTVVSSRKLGINPKPFLMTEGILTNVGGLLTLISSIPNIIVGNIAGISFVSFMIKAGPYTVIAVIVTVFMAKWMFSEDIRTLVDPNEVERAQQKVNEFDEWEAVQDFTFFKVTIVSLIGVIFAFAFQSQLPVLREMGLEHVAFGAGILMLIIHPSDVEETLSKVEWSLVFFFFGLFTIIGVMEEAQVLKAIGTFLAMPLVWGEGVASIIILWAAALASAVTDNIPLAAMLAKILSGMDGVTDSSPLWWSVVFGANLGGNISPIGSASIVVAVTIMAKENIKMSFLEFVRVGGLFAFGQLLVATVYMWLFLF